MSNQNVQEFGEEDFGGGEPVREVEEEFRQGEAVVDTGGPDEESSTGNDAETMNLSKRIKEMSVDRLSTLPESLIIYILSFFDLREAANTSVLSKRWQYLWADLPFLNFDQDRVQSVPEFVSWVHRTLILRSVNYVERLRISFDYENCYASDVTSWLEYAVKIKVKELILLLEVESTDLYMLPQVIYSASSLTLLSMEDCIIAPHIKIEWKSMIELIIDGVELHEDVIAKMLEGCPVLRSLQLTACRGYNRLDITSPSLYSLRITDYENEDTGPMLEISAPYIQYLDVAIFPIARKKLRLTNVASLVGAIIDFDVMHDSVNVEALNNTMEFFENIHHVKKLELGDQCMKVISELLVNGWSLPQSKRGSLKISTRRYENYISGIVVLLESSPDLDTLVIRCSYSYEEVRTFARADLNCDLVHLKFVELSDYADPNLDGEPVLVARIILKRATSLQKMVIKFQKCSYASDYIKMTERVLSYPKSSDKAVVVFCE